MNKMENFQNKVSIILWSFMFLSILFLVGIVYSEIITTSERHHNQLWHYTSLAAIVIALTNFIIYKKTASTITQLKLINNLASNEIVCILGIIGILLGMPVKFFYLHAIVAIALMLFMFPSKK